MARSLYVPVHLHARLVRGDDARPAVPTLEADPCATPTGPALAPGVHLHWALPDALTRGEVDRTSQQLRFAALPDRWIVVRFASVSVAAPAPGVLLPLRTCKAFVVDAKLKITRPLGDLTFAPDREPRWLTVLGLLTDGTPPPAGADQTPAFAHLESAYYPTARDRFGFYDDLDDLLTNQVLGHKLNKGGPWEAIHLSYAVVGHYSSAAEDPLARAGDAAGRLKWLEHARLRVDLAEARHTHKTTVHGKPLTGVRPLKKESLVMLETDGRTSMLEASSIKKMLGTPKTSNKLSALVESVELELDGARVHRDHLAQLGVKTIDIGASVPEDSSGVPARLVCHGAVVDVGPRGRYRHASGQAGSVDIAASASAAIEQAFLDIGGAEVFAILRGGLDGEASSTAGKQSLPHLLHAAGFDASPQETPDREYLAIVVDAGANDLPADAGVPAGAPLRIVDRRGAPGRTPLEFGIPVEELAQLRLELKTARVYVEARAVPKPRWHRPATPVLALGGHGRSYRHGHDGRMRSDGRLLCRAGGQTAVSLACYTRRISGDRLVDLGLLLRFEPAFVRELLFEAALLDPSNAARAAGLALQGASPTQIDVDVAVKTFHEATERWWALGDPGAALPDAIALFTGTLPAPFAVTPWSDPWLPLFAELRYTLTPDCTASATGQSLGELDLAVVDARLFPAINASERQVLSSMLPATVQSAIARLRDRLGKSADVKTRLDQVVYRLAHLDLMTATLGELDPRVRDHKYAFRSGSLAVTSLRLVDTFGTVRTIELLPKRVLPPRLTSWARVQTRLVGTTSDGDANPVRSPVCGFLLFDAVEQALEAFDPVGAPLGQLRHDRSPAHNTLWERAPSRDATDLETLKTPVLKDILQAMLAPRVGPEPNPSALQAALAALDTARFSVARRLPSDDYRAALCGRPIVVVRAHLTLELAGIGESDGPSGAAANLPDKVHVRLGCLDQLDDGLLGFFMYEDNAWHLHPIPHAATDTSKSPYLKHPLLREGTSFELKPGAANKREVLLLLDGLSAFHVQTGLLPRKRIEISELIPARIVAQILPTLAVGPLLFESARRRVPAPQLPGHSWSWVSATADDFTVSPIAAFAPATSEMPDAPPAVHAGWIRLDLDKP